MASIKRKEKKNAHKEIPNPSSSKPPQLTPRDKKLPVRGIKEQEEVSQVTLYSYLPTNFQCSVNQQWIEHEQRQLDPRATMATPRTMKLAVNRVSTSTLLPVTRTIEASENFLFVYMLLSICIALLVASQIMSGWCGIPNLGNWFRSIFEKFRTDDLSAVRFLKRLCSWFWKSTKNEPYYEELVHPDNFSYEKQFEKILQELREPEQKEEDFRNREKELAEKLEEIRRRGRDTQHDAIPTDNEPTTCGPLNQKDSIAYRTRSASNREKSQPSMKFNKRVNDKPNSDVEKQEDDHSTADSLLPAQPRSSYSGYEDKFASLERNSQKELAKKLAEQDRYYEEKLKTARRIRKERNEDAQEEIRSIKESQKERLRLFHQK